MASVFLDLDTFLGTFVPTFVPEDFDLAAAAAEGEISGVRVAGSGSTESGPMVPMAVPMAAKQRVAA